MDIGEFAIAIKIAWLAVGLMAFGATDALVQRLTNTAVHCADVGGPGECSIAPGR